MTTVDITQQVIRCRQEAQLLEEQLSSTQTIPEWMQKPFDDYFAHKNNVIPVDFGKPIITIPKTLAAGSPSRADESWFEQGMISYKNEDGAVLSITFNKASDHDGIDVTIFINEGESTCLKPYEGQSNILCSVYDQDVQLATLRASVNHDSTFMYAEGQVINNQSISSGGDYLSIRFNDI